ncbi:MAG: response regulator [Myxococcota bacterium]
MKQTARILLAEDNDELREAVRRVAREHSFEIVQTSHGAEVLTLALDAKPDLIILDVAFSDLDGRDVLARLKADERTQAIPVLVWSGRHEAESDRRIALELGAEDYMEKVDAQTLLRKAQRILLRFN